MSGSQADTGYARLNEGNFEEALYWFERALEANGHSVAALEGAGNALIALGRPAEALGRFRQLLQLQPKSAKAHHGAGEALQQLGRIGEARVTFERAVALEPRGIHHHYALAQIARFMPGDPRLAALEELAAGIALLSDPEQGELHFALAKAYDELGRYADAFAHFKSGNDLKRRWVAYEEASTLGLMRAMAAAFTPALLAARRTGNPSDVPVFVIGMPRAGTTLVEQILASHPKVFGAGETMYLHRLLGQNLLGEEFPAGVERLPADAFHRFGSFYVTRLRAEAPAADRIVDKLPANFLVVGLIRLALPRARIIHVRRDPLDTCFSCYANLFAENIDYSYELGELGRYYRGYEELMAHWRRVVPADSMLEVRYEDVVADLRGEARRIVAHCGLEWDDRCVSFHQTERVVHTLSAAQVRQPLYRTAVGRAAHYRQWLEPLIAALDGR